MPGPLPTGNAIRRNAPTIPTRNFPASGFGGAVPEPIEPLDEVEARYYAWAWSTPAAAGWHWSDGEVVAEWARLKAHATRVQRGEVTRQTAGGMTVLESVTSAIYGQITAREDRLMFSPSARLKSRAEIVDDVDEASDGDEDYFGSRFS